MTPWTEQDEQELQALKDEAAKLKPKGSGAKDDPIIKDVIPATTALSLGFGTIDAADKELSARGLKHVGTNKYGQLIGQDENGNWVSDDNQFLYGAPKHLPEVASVVASAFPTTKILQIAAAAMGGAFGEGGKQWAANLLGTRKGYSGKDMAIEGGKGALGQTVAIGLNRAPVGKIPLPAKAGTVGEWMGGQNMDEIAANAARKLLIEPYKRFTAFASGKLSGAGTEAAQRAIDRPKQVQNALDPKNIANVADNAATELDATMRAEGQLSRDARRKFKEQYGKADVDTSDIIKGLPGEDGLDKIIAEAQPNELGLGSMTDKELKDLGWLRNEALSTPARGNNSSFDVRYPRTSNQRGLPLEGRVTVPAKNLGSPGELTFKEVEQPLPLPGHATRDVELATPKASHTEIQDSLKTTPQEEIPGQEALFGGSTEARVSPHPSEQPRMANSHPQTQLTQRMRFSKYGATPATPAKPGLDLGFENPMSSEPPFSIGGDEDMPVSEMLKLLEARDKALTPAPVGQQFTVPSETLPKDPHPLMLPLTQKRYTKNPIASEVVTEKSFPADQLGLDLQRQRFYPLSTGTPPIASSPAEHYQYGLPLPQTDASMSKPAESLLGTADWLDRQIRTAKQNAHDKNLPQDNMDKQISIWKGVAGKIKDKLHNLSPDYAKADARFSGKAGSAEIMGPVRNASTAENFIKSAATREQREAVRNAARDVTPNTADSIEDIMASHAFNGGYRGLVSPKRLLGLGLALGGGAYAVGYGDPGAELGILGGMSALTSPRLHRFALTRGSRLMGSPWSLMGQKMNSITGAATHVPYRELVQYLSRMPYNQEEEAQK